MASPAPEADDDPGPEVDDDGFEVDPALAAAMGFSAFGNATKRRKYVHHDAVVAGVEGTAGDGRVSAQGANAMPLGVKREAKRKRVLLEDGDGGALIDDRVEVSTADDIAASRSDEAPKGDMLPLRVEERDDRVAESSTGSHPIQAYRDGVRLATGDVAYFLPSFIEDPWKTLLGKT